MAKGSRWDINTDNIGKRAYEIRKQNPELPWKLIGQRLNVVGSTARVNANKYEKLIIERRIQ
ncbi:MAG: hypothetical protein WC900_10405 [Oscillospiraceae bacterium]|jgi:hypothetical protein